MLQLHTVCVIKMFEVVQLLRKISCYTLVFRISYYFQNKKPVKSAYYQLKRDQQI